MKKYLIFVVSGFLFSCSPKDVPVDSSDNSEVDFNHGSDTIPVIENDSSFSVITCPKCNFKKKEILPTDYCILKYTCTNCKAEIYPDDKDCCVFCTYGTYKCLSKQ